MARADFSRAGEVKAASVPEFRQGETDHGARIASRSCLYARPLAMSARPSFLAELRRRNVLRAGALYIGAIWALAQGIAQLAPVFGAPEWLPRWFAIAGVIGFPFWILFAWFFELTPEGLKLERDVAPGASIMRETGRKLDFWIIGVLAAAVVLLLTNQLVHRDAASAVSDQSVAVLPLANEGGNEDEQYFSDGLSEDLIITLSHFAGLKVISRNSSFKFRDSKDDSRAIGAQLGVAHLLEGSVRRDGARVRIIARLIETAGESELWSKTYERTADDWLAVQADVASLVARSLIQELVPGVQAGRRADEHPVAYQAYLRGRYHWAKPGDSGLTESLRGFEEATQLAPDFAAAHGGLARVRVGSAEYYHEPPRQALIAARVSASRALELDPSVSEAVAVLADVRRMLDMDWSGAETGYLKALA
ncbi:MAG TPA: hypothetical protein VJ696_02090, partial [Rhodanobacteraceae bacterium]|nr:hypothetical protein [Rhodanobacteraceae bacterium]